MNTDERRFNFVDGMHLRSSAFIGGFKLLARDIKLSHSVFALPWAILATFMASGGWPRAGQLALIVLCMVTSRTVAMSMNRLLDAKLDALNPRTARRAIPSGVLSKAFVVSAVVGCSLLFIAATSLFGFVYRNWLPLICSLPVLAFIGSYPLLKLFTRLCHYYLGAALALAPLCAWIAIAGRIDLPPILMAGAVLCWTAGFDIIYACQDYENDLKTGVVSVPARVGIAKALWISRLTHTTCLGFLIALGLVSSQLGSLYLAGISSTAVLMIVEHWLVSPTDLSKVNVAFFTINGIISILVGCLGIADVLRHGT
jgi:4-hydroxybenzoate polyprenyltransferase